MALPDLVRGHPWAAGAVVGAIVGLAGGLLWPLPDVSAPAAGDLRMALPARAALTRYSDADFAVLRNTPLWNGSAGAQAGRANMANWRLLGVVQGPAGAALVQVDNRQSSVPVGAQLPDGTRLVAVGASAVVLRRDGCDFRRTLYATAEEALPGEGCAAASAPNAAPTAAGN